MVIQFPAFCLFSFLTRSNFCSFIADEEIGGHEGMQKFVVSQAFKKLNIGLVLDEGLASANEVIPVYYGERNVYWVKFHCGGNPGHGSRFVEGAPGEKVQYIINKVLGFRSEQKKIFESDSKMTLGDVTTVNLTMMQGGVQVFNKDSCDAITS